MRPLVGVVLFLFLPIFLLVLGDRCSPSSALQPCRSAAPTTTMHVSAAKAAIFPPSLPGRIGLSALLCINISLSLSTNHFSCLSLHVRKSFPRFLLVYHGTTNHDVSHLACSSIPPRTAFLGHHEVAGNYFMGRVLSHWLGYMPD